MNEEDILCATREFVTTQGEGKALNIGRHCDRTIAPHKLARFVTEYVKQHRPDLCQDIGSVSMMLRILLIIVGGETNEGKPSGIQKRVGTRAWTARRWLRCLGFE
jgi:hypothetical protein